MYILVLHTGCRKFVDVGTPSTQLVQASVFESDATATSAMLSIYATMEGLRFFYSLTYFAGLSSDEMITYATNVDYTDLSNNNLTPLNTLTLRLWTDLYNFNYQANAVIEGLESSEGVSELVKKQLKGEAHFIRALCHYYLKNLYGDIPIITSTDFHINAMAGRSIKSEVEEQIANDLEVAIGLLGAGYVSGQNGPTTERVRPNKYTALALLAKVQLEMENWQLAEQLATEIISQGGLYSLGADITQIFKKDHKESIWQLMPVVTGSNSVFGAFIFTSNPTNGSLTDTLVNSFEPGDLRRENWVGEVTTSGHTYYYPYKYKVSGISSTITEHTIVIRLAEMYLVRAEARLRQNNMDGAKDDLNAIRQRAGLTNITTSDPAEIFIAIGQERKIEFFAENGFRWMDLSRMGMVDEVLGGIKSPNWQPEDKVYPIPQSERNRNPNLSQNPGY